MNLAQRRSGLGIALLSSAAFGTSGSFATALIGSGWSPAAAVTVRLLIASTTLTVPALLLLRGQLDSLLRQARSIGSFGVIAIAAGQLCYFNAVARLSVGVALLLEYLGILLVVGWLWARQGQRPRRLTVAGAVAALVGLVLVLDITGQQRLDPIGVLWGLGAAVGLATYFVISAQADAALPPIAMAWAGMTVGAGTLKLLAQQAALLERRCGRPIRVIAVSARDKQRERGVSLAGLLRGKGAPKREALFWHYPHYSNQGGVPGGAVRQGDWKLIGNVQSTPDPALTAEALGWATTRGARSGRVAWQFIQDLAGRLGHKLEL